MKQQQTILDLITKRRKQRIARYGHAQALDIAQRRTLPLQQFAQEPTLICEIKRKSPSHGVISRAFNHTAQAARYHSHGVTAFSVLTEEDYFGGSLRHLIDIKQKFPQCAILRKDFLFDEADIAVSYRAGADALLLIAALLSGDALYRLHQAAERLGMRALIEVHSEQEIAKIRPFRPDLVGINSRDLTTFTTDLLLPLSLRSAIDWRCTVVFESGISCAEQVAVVVDAQFDSVLVGETAMKQSERIPLLQKSIQYQRLAAEDSPVWQHAKRKDFWMRLSKRKAQLLTKRPLVKICGITNRDDALCAQRCGADMLGFIFAESPRQTTETCVIACADIAILKVAVVVADGAPNETVRSLLRNGYIDAVQIHNAERDAPIGKIFYPYYRALRVKTAHALKDIDTIPEPRVLLDAYHPHKAGGTGRQIAAAVLDAMPPHSALWIAGGISVENIGDIIAQRRPELVDVSSKLEAMSGKKDHQKIEAFFAEVSRASAQ